MTPAPTSCSSSASADLERQPAGLLSLARTFFAIGMRAFGGQSALLALLTCELVEHRRWVTDDDICEAFTYVQLLPGAVVVQVAAYLGWKLRGGLGAAVATIAFLLPSVLLMLGISVVYQRIARVSSISAALNGQAAAAVGIVAYAVWKQAHKNLRDVLGTIISLTVFLSSVLGHLNPALLVITAGLIGILRDHQEEKREAKPQPTGEPVP